MCLEHLITQISTETELAEYESVEVCDVEKLDKFR